MIKKNTWLLIILSIGLLISILYTHFYWKNFINTNHTENLDGFILDPIEGISFEPGKYKTPSIIGKDTVLYFIIGKQILDSYKKNKNFFSAQQEFKISFLYPNIIAFFSHYFNDEIIKNKEIIIGKKSFLIIFQIFFYYFSLLFFSCSLQKYTDDKKNLLIISFLSLEPTIMQWNVAFMTESLFFSCLIISLSLLLKKKNSAYFYSGIIIGISFLMRSFIIYYLIIILLYLIIKYRFLFIKPAIYFFLGISIIIIPLIANNYYRSKVVYLLPMQAKLHIAHYHEHHILARGTGISIATSQKILSDRNNEWIKKNIRNNSESERIKYYNYRQSEAYNSISKYKFEYCIMLMRGIFKNSLLNPLHMWIQNTQYHNSKDYLQSTDQKKVLKISIIYSLLIYSLSLVSLISFIKKNANISFLLIGSIIYFSFMASIGGSQRYFSPAIIFVSFFFCSGLKKIFILLQNRSIK